MVSGQSNTVVLRSAVGCCVDEINVEVVVVILLEVSGDNMALTLELLSIDGQLAHKHHNLFLFAGFKWNLLLLLLLPLLLFFLAFFEVDLDCLCLIGFGCSCVDCCCECSFVPHLFNAEVERDQVGRRNSVVARKLLIGVEGKGVGAALGAGPEHVSAVVLVVSWEQVKKIADSMVVVGLKHLARHLHALLEVCNFLQLDECLDLAKRGGNLEWPVFLHFVHLLSVVFDEGDCILRPIEEDTGKLVAAPLNAMLDLAGEVAHRAHRDRLFWRIDNVVVGE